MLQPNCLGQLWEEFPSKQQLDLLVRWTDYFLVNPFGPWDMWQGWGRSRTALGKLRQERKDYTQRHRHSGRKKVFLLLFLGNNMDAICAQWWHWVAHTGGRWRSQHSQWARNEAHLGKHPSWSESIPATLVLLLSLRTSLQGQTSTCPEENMNLCPAKGARGLCRKKTGSNQVICTWIRRVQMIGCKTIEPHKVVLVGPEARLQLWALKVLVRWGLPLGMNGGRPQTHQCSPLYTECSPSARWPMEPGLCPFPGCFILTVN